MAGCLLPTGNESVTLSVTVVRALEQRGDGDAALLYLALLRHQGTVPPRSLAGELRWEKERIERAEGILREAQEKAKQMVTREAIYAEAKKRSEDLVGQTQNRINQLRKAGNDYMDESLRQTEEAISKALAEVRDTRMKFRTVTEAQEQRKTVNVDVEV